MMGTTTSRGLQTTTGPVMQTTFTGNQAPFVAELNFSNPSILTYYTYLLGSGAQGSVDVGTAIAVDQATGDVFVGGSTIDGTPPLGPNTITGQGTFRPFSSYEYAGFVAELNTTASPSSLLFFSYLWGPDTHNPVNSIYGINGTQVIALALDGADNIYVTGTTDEPDLPTTAGAVGGASGTPTDQC